MNTQFNMNAIGNGRKLSALSLFLMLLWLPQQVMAVDELGLFELDANFADDAATFDSCGWGTHGDCPTGWSDNVPASSSFDLRDGLVDINEDGFINTTDDGTVTVGGTSFTIKDGFVDRDGDNKVSTAENDNGDTCYYIGDAPSDGHVAGGCFDGFDVLFGFVDYNLDGVSPSADQGNDAENLFNGDADSFRLFFGRDDTLTALNTAPICNTGIPDSDGDDCTMYTGGGSKDTLPITEYVDWTVISGRVDTDVPSDGIDTGDDKIPFGLYELIDGYVDVDLDGSVPDEDDDGEYLGYTVIDSRIVIGTSCAITDDPGTLASGASCAGTIPVWIGGWEWTEGNFQNKNDINVGFAGTWLYETTTPGTIHQNNDFILYYGLDIIPASGSAVASFWLMQDESVNIIQDQGQTNNTRQWVGQNNLADLLIQVNQANNEANVYVWNPTHAAGTGTADDAFPTLDVNPADGQTDENPSGSPNLSPIYFGTTCEEGTGEQPTCAVANTRQEPVPTSPTEWPYTHEFSNVTDYYDIYNVGNTIEGGVNVSAVYRELGVAVPCFSKAIVSTRTTGSVSGTLTDFLLTGFESCSIDIRKTGDTVAMVGDTVWFTIEIENTGLLPLNLKDITDDLVDGQAGAGATLDAAVAAGCSRVEPREICSFQVPYVTSAADTDPLLNTVSGTLESLDGIDSFSESDTHTVDLIYPGTIGNQVWLDEDGNGSFDAGEDGFANVTVDLFADRNNDGFITSLDTSVNVIGNKLDINGDGIADSNDDGSWYGIRVIDGLLDFNNDGFIDATGGTDSGTMTVNGTTFTITNGLIDGGAISGGAGTIDGAWAQETTDANGEYLFTDLPGNIYDVVITVPSGTDVTYDHDQGAAAGGGTPDSTMQLTLADGENNTDADFGLNWVPYTSTDNNTGTGAIGDRIWSDDGDGIQEQGEAGIAGVTVYLYEDDDGSGNFDGIYSTLVATTTTDSSGNYIFDGVDAGAYVVQVDETSLTAAGVTNTTPTGDPDGDGDNTSKPILLAPGDVYVNADWGYSAGTSVDGTIYFDQDVSGGKNAGDTGLYGITVNLVDASGNIVATSTTDENGLYNFTGVLDGTYTVEVGDTGGVLADSRQTGDPSSGQTGAVCTFCDGIGEVSVSGGTPETGIDFGFVPREFDAGEGLISGSVGLDLTNPTLNQFDAGEELEGIGVTLYQLYDIDSGKFDLDGDGSVGSTFGDPDDSGAIFVDETGDGLNDTVYCVFEGRIDIGCDGSIVNVINGLIDINGDGVITTADDGTYQGYLVIDGYIDLNGDNFITDADDNGGSLFGVPIIDGWFNFDGAFTDNIGTRDLSPMDPNDTFVLTNGDDLTPATGSFLDGYFVIDGLMYTDLGGTTIASGEQIEIARGTTQTDSSGFYAFGNLDPTGVYRTELDATTFSASTTYDFDFGGGIANGTSSDIYLGSSGGIQTDVDFGLITSGLNSLSGTIWNDLNADGTLAGEAVAFIGVTVELYDSAGKLVATTTTDASGNYTFANLANGTYTVKVTDENRVLTGYWLSDGPNDGADNNSQTDPYTVSLSGGENNTTADFGYYIDPAIVGDTVFKDLNGDGLQQLGDGETGFAGTEVKLTISYPNGTVVTVVTTTDADGNYSFGNLLLDEDFSGVGSGQPTYEISVDEAQATLIGYETTEQQANATDDAAELLGSGVDDDADTVSGTAAYPVQGGTDDTNDFGFALPSALFGNATGLVWLDVDHDGVWDVGEPGINDVTVSLYTDRDGDGFVDPEVYVVGNALDLDGDGFVNSDDNGAWYGVDVIGGLLDMNGDGVVDANDNGSITTVDGVTYTITAGAIQAANGAIDGAWDQTLTDANGNYSFSDLPAGNYAVQVDPSESSLGDLVGLDPTAGNDGTFDAVLGGTTSFNLTAGEAEVLQSLGYVPDAGTAVIEGNVFSDASADGIFDPTEVGIGSVTVQLFNLDGSPALDGQNKPIIVETGPDGSYILTGIEPGDYYVGVITTDSDLVNFCADTGTTATCNTTLTVSDPITVDIDDTVSGVNFGFDNPDNFKIIDTVWDDLNGDGIQGAGEAGIAGVTIDLVDCNGICGDGDDVLIATVTTDENGDYAFEGVPEGTYEMVISDNNGVLNDYYETTATGGSAEVTLNDTTTGGDGILNTVGDDGSATFGFRKPGTIGGSIYSDADNFGTYDDAESGYGGVLVQLYDDLGNLVAETLTAADGSYNFEYVDPGSYEVVVESGNFASGKPLDGSTQTGDPDQVGTDCTTFCDDKTTTLLVLGAGESIQNVDFGYNNPALSDISGTVFNDHNENAAHEPDGGDGLPGTVEDNETGIEGVTIALQPVYDIIDGQIDLDGDPNTDDNGFVSGTIDYVQVFNGLLDINGDGIANEFDDGTFNGITVINGNLDMDGDGLVSGAETPGEDNGTVIGNPVATTVTDADGNYEFQDVPDGNYIVAVTDNDNVVDGYTLTSGLDEQEVTADSTLGDVTDIDFGYVADSGSGSIGDTVWLDSNGDGIQNGNEPGIAGVDVELFSAGDDGIRGTADDVSLGIVTTDADGNFLFDDLTADDYYLNVNTATVPSDLLLTISDFNYVTDLISLSEGEEFLDADIGYTATTLGTIGDTVWLDDGDGVREDGEAGISGVTINLYDPGPDGLIGGGDDVFIATTTTDADGNYSFAGLTADDYYIDLVESTLPDGGADYDPTTGTAGTHAGDGRTGIIALSGGEFYDDADFGYVPASGTAIIGDRIWSDANGDGVQDEGETGIGGVTVTLVPPSGVDLGNGVDQPITTVTAADGSYEFTGLPPGEYTVTVDSNTVGGTNTGDPDATNDGTTTLTVVADTVYDDVDFGYQDGTTSGGSIGDKIYSDTNGNSTLDAGEVGIAGVTVNLYDSNGDLVATTTTDVDGEYTFSGLPAGNYVVEVTDTANVLAGRTATQADGSVTLGTNQTYINADFGFAPNAGVILGDKVWYDTDGDGLQEPGEVGIPGVVVIVYDPSTDTTYTYTTDEYGNWLAIGLPAGVKYIVTIDDSTLPEDVNPTPTNLGDGDTYITPVLTDGDVLAYLDFGFTGGVNGAIGDTVWLDTNIDGTRDEDEEGLSGITMRLYSVGDDGIVGSEDDFQVAFTTTDANGEYLFTGLQDGNYYVEYYVFSEVNGLDPTVGTAGTNAANRRTGIISLVDGEFFDAADFGFIPNAGTAVIGDRIWSDADGDGVQDDGEAGIGGVTVYLCLQSAPTCDAANAVKTVVTDADGSYLFTNVVPGDYTVAVDSGTVAGINTGDPDETSPNGTPGVCSFCNGTTDLTVAADTIYDDVDFGYYDEFGAGGVIGDYIYSDLNGDGDCELVSGVCTEPGIDGITVDLWTIGIINGGVDLNGDGVINGLDDGSYAGYPVINGLVDFNKDGSVFGDAGYTAGDDNGTVNGFTLIDGRLDTDGVNGVDSADDLPAQLIATTVTANGGSYEFTGLTAGDYRVDVTDTGNLLGGSTVTQSPTQDLTIACPGSPSPCTVIDDADFGYALTTTVGAINGSIWWDDNDGTLEAGEALMSGVQIDLYDANGNLVATTFTDADGNYTFAGLPPGDYTVDVVEATLPGGYSPTGDTDGTGSGPNATNGQTATITVVGGDTYNENFAYVPTSGTAIIGDRIWSDANGDGVQDEGETGIGGVTVTLVPPSGVDLGNGPGNSITTVTAADGSYEFTGLPPGEYTVTVDSNTVGGTITGDPDATIDGTTTLTVVADTVYDDVDFGYQDGTSSIGDKVYADTNGNGSLDTGEAGIAGVTVNLYDSNGDLVATATTDVNGEYTFSGLPAGDYQVDVTDTANVLTGRYATQADGSVSLGTGETYVLADFGFAAGSDTGSIGDFIYFDANGDGDCDPVNGVCTEAGISGVTVDLIGAGPDGVFGTADDTLDTTTSDQNGNYVFDGLKAGLYEIVVTDLNDVVGELMITETADAPILLNCATTCTDVKDADFGYKPTVGDVGNIGGTIWRDTINPGIAELEAGEPGIGGVEVELWLDVDGDGIITPGIDNLVRTTTTDANGDYNFLGLPPDEYIVRVPDDDMQDVAGNLGTNEVLADMQRITHASDPTADSNGHVNAYPVTLTSGVSDTTVDFAYIAETPYDISGKVYEDADGEGGAYVSGQDALVPGAVVTLYRIVDGEELLVESTTTDGDGEYEFLDLPGGFDYVVKVDTSGTVVDGLDQTVDPDGTLDSETSFTLIADTSGVDFAYNNGGVVTTPVTLSYFEATAGEEEGDVQFNWSTVTEAGNVGFDLYVVSDGDIWTRVNMDFIPAIEAGPTDMRDYSYLASGVPEGAFYIVDIDINGVETEHGPFILNQSYGRKDLKPNPINIKAIQDEHDAKQKAHNERKKGKMKEKLKKQKDKLKKNGRWEAANDAGQPNWATRLAGGVLSLLVGSAQAAELPVTDTGLIQFHVTQSGVHRVSYEQLADAGLDLAGVDDDVIALTNQGEPVPLNVVNESGSKKSFGSGWYIEFVGENLETLYSKTNVYSLYLDEAKAERVLVDSSKPSKKAQAEPWYLETTRVEAETSWDFSSTGGDPWYMTRMLAYRSAYSNDFEIDLQAYAGNVAPVNLGVDMWGVTDWPEESDDHHLQLSFNETLVADEWFDGAVNYPLRLELPSGTPVVEGTNTLNITLPYDTGYLFDLVNLDAYEVTYPRRFEAMAGQRLDFIASGALFEVQGLANQDVLVYRTDVDGSTSILSRTKTTAQGDGNFSVQFPGITVEAGYLVVTEDAVYSPALVPPPEEIDITSLAAKYLIIAHPDFIGINADNEALYSLEDLKLAREQRGFSVVLADIEQVYAQFGHGVVGAQAIKDYITYAYQNMGTEMVLLVGGDTFDYHGYLGAGPVSFVPSLYAQTGQVVHFAPVDPKYADVNDDDLPDLAIGRFPVRSSDELSQMVHKTLVWDTGDRNMGANAYGQTALFIADGYDAAQDYNFKQDAEIMRALAPSEWQAGITQSYLDDIDVPLARSTIIDTVNDGVALTSFVGHSGYSIWTFDNLFSAQDAIGLTNNLRPTVVTQWGCWNTYYVSNTENTMAHEFLLNGEQGAVAVLGASTLTEASHERQLARQVYDRMFVSSVDLGTAILAAKQQYAESAPEHLDVILGWTLLGDPALIMAE